RERTGSPLFPYTTLFRSRTNPNTCCGPRRDLRKSAVLHLDYRQLKAFGALPDLYQLFHALNLDHYLGLAALKPGIKPFALVRLCSFCTHHSRMCHLRRYLAGPHAKVSSDHHNLFELHWLLSHSLINRVKNTLLVFCKMLDYDVIVAGGSVSGLLAAREAAAGGLSV